MSAKHCLQAFKLDCRLRRLTDRTIKGYYNNTLTAEQYREIIQTMRAGFCGSRPNLEGNLGLLRTLSKDMRCWYKS